MSRQFNGKYEYNQDGINEIISERGDIFLALREVRWTTGKPFKLDLRNYRSSEEGDITLKGCSFNDDNADELTRVLIENGFGDNTEIADTIVQYRPDLCRELKSIFNDRTDLPEIDSRVTLFQRRQDDDERLADENGDDYFNPKDILGE